MARAMAVVQPPEARVRQAPSGLGLWLWVVACLGWLLGVAWQWQSVRLAPAAWFHGCVALGALGLLSGVWLEWRTPLRWRRLVLLPVFALAAALLAWGSTGWRVSQVLAQRWPSHLNGVDVWAVLKLEGLPQPLPPAGTEGRALRWRLDAAVLRWEGVQPEPGWRLPEHITLYADWPGSVAPRAGQSWRMRLRLHAPDGLSNPGVNSGTRSAFGRGVRAVGQLRPGADSLQLAGDGDAPSWQDRIDRWRQGVREAILQRVPSAREAGVLSGLAVGDQAAIASGDWDVLRRTGVAHAVSISGAHVAMLGSLCAALTRRLWSRSSRLCHWLPAPTAALWVAVLGAAAYALASGGGVPAQRTVWTMALMSALRLLGGAWPWPLVWLSCATLVTVWDPFALMQPGFWLSFVAVAVLMSAGERSLEVGFASAPTQRANVRGMPGVWCWLRDEAMALWRTQRLVSLALMPLSLVCFQQASLVGAAANLLAVPIFGALITPLALAGTVFPPAWDVAAACTGLAFQGLQWLSDLPMAIWATPSPPLWVAVAAVVASFALALPGPWRWRSLALPFLLPLLLLPEPWRVLPRPALGQFAAVAMDVGQGTAVLVRTAQHSLLFDTGASLPAGGDMGARVVLPVLQALGVRRLDALLISHQDNDHVGGALSVVRGVPVGVLRSSLPEDHGLLARHADRLPSGTWTLPHQPCAAGQAWTWDGVRFEVLHPTQADLQNRQRLSTNALSCVLRVQADGGQSLLLTGDIEAPQEQALLAREGAARLRSTVLVVPHHGSQTSSTPAFLAAVQAQEAVIQAGRRNRYGHPSPPVLARYVALGVHVDATPACGAWLWQSDERWGKGRCWRSQTQRLWDEASSNDGP
ncbi:MAG: DNA internalization-related competence protein ComEC/Rec2 [Aquabacterium sp.]|uniref:DNA internalization-related competence protein ComEC/Rec2 n=1 Tax=Aquabacterium sp. TaxID=1872578 RepID=UPI001D9811A9|nr:DNA internalization-related competence protein ComEC/Rec2 [Aquabacterium sp.]MBT9610667.1 DNA internalization-related competence protein ComEC/Rec2 [Aquabacterium sp.]